MKNTWPLCLFALFFSCSNEEASIKNFIPGTYVRTVQNEFSEGRDTLLIQHAGSDTYTVEHLLTYRRITDGKPGAQERKTEHWVAVYDEKSAVLLEQKRGRLFTFQPDKATLMVGRSLYQKMN